MPIGVSPGIGGQNQNVIDDQNAPAIERIAAILVGLSGALGRLTQHIPQPNDEADVLAGIAKITQLVVQAKADLDGCQRGYLDLQKKLTDCQNQLAQAAKPAAVTKDGKPLPPGTYVSAGAAGILGVVGIVLGTGLGYVVKTYLVEKDKKDRQAKELAEAKAKELGQ